MAKDFRVVGGNDGLETILATIATATVLEAGDLVGLSSGIITKAVASDTAIAYCPYGSADGEVKVEISKGNDFMLEGTADANYAVTDKAIFCDLVGTTTLLIDLGTTSTSVFNVDASENAGTDASTLNVRVKIALPLI